MIKPTIHINGSDKKEMVALNLNAVDKIWEAISECERCYPNARDYYPQGNGAYPQAKKEFEEQLAKLTEVRQYFYSMVEYLEDLE